MILTMHTRLGFLFHHILLKKMKTMHAALWYRVTIPSRKNAPSNDE